MAIKIPKLKFKNPFSLKYLYILAAAAASAVLIALGVFLYQYPYQIVAQSKEIVLLRSQVAPEAINLDEVKKILEFLDKKIASDGIKWEEIKNPFVLSDAAPTPAPAAPAAR